MNIPDYRLEQARKQQGYRHICGVDEVGRGPWAGPVIACAVILPDQGWSGMKDSKKLSAKRRAVLSKELYAAQIPYAFGAASVQEIDQINILQASLLAMRRAILRLPISADFALIDGRHIPQGLPCPAAAVIGGDGKSDSIAAASILAKILRDDLMAKLALRYSAYGWEKNAGYGVAKHQQGLDVSGVSPHHRRSFRPIAMRLVPSS